MKHTQYRNNETFLTGPEKPCLGVTIFERVHKHNIVGGIKVTKMP